MGGLRCRGGCGLGVHNLRLLEVFRGSFQPWSVLLGVLGQCFAAIRPQFTVLLVMVHEPTLVAKHCHLLVLEQDPEGFGITHVHKVVTAERLLNINRDSDPNVVATTITIW